MKNPSILSKIGNRSPYHGFAGFCRGLDLLFNPLLHSLEIFVDDSSKMRRPLRGGISLPAGKGYLLPVLKRACRAGYAIYFKLEGLKLTTPEKSEKKGTFPITLCMVNYNGEEYLENSLGSAYAQKEKFEDMILIDNASVDRSIAIVREKFPGVKVIGLEKNFGPGTARNEGFRAASSALILFMDNDVILTPECPGRLLQALNDDPLAVIAMPRVLYDNDRDTIQFDGADSHYLGLMILHNENVPLVDAAEHRKKLGSVVTACFLLDKKKWGDREPFDDDFFYMHEDHDFGMKTRAMGHGIVSIPLALCFHGEGTSGLSLRRTGKYSKVRVYCTIRNRWMILIKNYQVRTLVLLFPLLFVYEIFQFAGAIKKGWLTEWLRALTWIISHFPQQLGKRKTIQRERTIPDRDIIRGGPVPFTRYLTEGALELAAKNVLDALAVNYWKVIHRLL
jgi:GT2 family glycosyltransferase